MHKNLKYAKTSDVRLSKVDDIDDMLDVFAHGRSIQHKSGNYHQWASTYPDTKLIKDDISKGISYVFVDNNKIYGSFMFLDGHDPSYDYIEDGKWLNEEPYGVIHRIASNETHKAVLHAAIDYAKKSLLKNHNKINLRIDTHKDNVIMKHLLEKERFKYVGIVYIDGVLKREAFHFVESC